MPEGSEETRKRTIRDEAVQIVQRTPEYFFYCQCCECPISLECDEDERLCEECTTCVDPDHCKVIDSWKGQDDPNAREEDDDGG